ncbi:MAG TPA: serine/threonine-protein kinase [Steroidobacteraceae bacterium]|nr:serine/threonine-protein kinase [Steroidobacteraceae bacterium]
MSTSDRDDALKRDAMAEMDRLLDKTQPERAKHLDALAHLRPDLHALVVDLLSYEEPANSGFMEPGKSSGSHALQAGSRLGPYRILRQLGEGGMGEVWLASRDDGLYDGQVAIKTLHPYFAGGALRERFLREAKVLGRLAHSNIARLLDAGIHEGVVYLVLEYVVGRPIDVACDAEKLDVSARLEIFLQLCGAVAHAHSSLVIHRDLKPGNVLLTADGSPKLLDFGIASFFESEKGEAQSDITRLTGRIFTPEYAAPEQVLGREITTSTDVYSLGVLLHVLLAGRLPYGPVEGARTQWEHAVVHEEPASLSHSADLADHERTAANRSTTFARLRRELSGDLENVVQKALQKLPEQRYLTVAAFADDVRRFLHGEPVLARADSAWYRLGKFARRNRLAVGATIAVVLALGAGLVVSLWQLRVAREERRHAEEVKEFVASIFRSADPYFTGKKDMMATELLALAYGRIERELKAKPQNAVELLNIVGESQVNLEQYDAADLTLTKAIEIAERLQPPDEVLIAEARVSLGWSAIDSGGREKVKGLLDPSLPVLRANQPGTARAYASALQLLAYYENDDGKMDLAISSSRESVAVLNAAFGPQNSETVLAKRHLALYYVLTHRYAEAKPLLEQTLHDARAMSPSGERMALLAMIESTYARMLIDLGEFEKAIEHLHSGIELASKAFGDKSQSVSAQLSLLVRAQARLGQMDQAIATARRNYEVSVLGENTARVLTNLGRHLMMARKTSEALETLRAAIVLEKEHDKGKGSWLPLALCDYGIALALSGRMSEAKAVLDENLPVAQASAAVGALPSAWNAIGSLQQLELRWADSEASFRQALEHSTETVPIPKFRTDALLGIGVARLELGQAADAEKWLRQADEAARGTYVNFIPLRADIAMNLGRALLAQGNVAAARESLAAADNYWRGFDASNRSAGEASYWLAQGLRAAKADGEARVEFARAVKILEGSPLRADAQIVHAARRELTR